ncbi:MAG: OmpA family protein [Bacteroidales bacterium]|nr:OmpA family protein [Bacteroidales bacterium]
MKFIGLSILAVFIITSSLFAQKSLTESADITFEEQKYSIAVDKYKKAYSKIKKNPNEKNRIRFQIAECYRLMNEPKRAETYYKGLIRNEYYKQKPEILLYYAQMLMINEKYDEAIPQFEEYIKLKPDDPRGSSGMKSCKLTKEWMEKPSNHQITNLRDVNSREDDFAPAYASDNYNSIIFTSNREGSTGKEADEWTGQNFTDLFYARSDRKGGWSTPDLLDKEGIINTETNEGIAKLNSTFSTLYFTRCGNEKNSQSGCHIYKASKQGRSFGQPEIIDLGGDSTSAIGHPSLSDDELSIFLAADFKGGYGGKDLYFATRKSRSDDFGRPKNMGPVINSPGDEMFPFLRGDTALYFSSNGHVGFGGMDMFKSTRNGEEWNMPVNMGYPLNTNADDYGIVFNPQAGEEGFFTSNRKEFERERSKGGDDIWYFIVPPLEFTLAGIVKDDRTLQYIESAEVRMVGSNGTSVTAKTNSIGRYEFNKEQFLANTTYELIVSMEGYFNSSGTETTVGVTRSKDFTHDFVLEPIPKKPIVLPEILYDLAKWDLKPQYQDSLQGLIQTLDQNPTLVVELASHTDARDTDERNDILSQKRAQSVVDYLILRGIDPERLAAKGYGERVPRVLDRKYYLNGKVILDSADVLTEDFINALPNTEIKEFAHQLNRRSEFSVLRNDFVPKEKLDVVVSPKIDIIVNPEAEVNSVPLKMDPEGRFGVKCEVNGYASDIYIDKKISAPLISLNSALDLLRKGAISKDDFEGDPNEILANSSIADKAVFLIEEIKIEKNYLNLIEVMVDHKLADGFLIDEATFQMIGDYTIDEDNKLMIFE